MGDHRLIDDVNRYSAAVIGVVLCALGIWSISEKGFEEYEWHKPDWEVYFVLFGMLFFLYFYKRRALVHNFGFMRHNFFRGLICFFLSLNLSEKTYNGKTFETMRKIGFWALIINLVLCICAFFMSGGDKRYRLF